MAGTVSGMDYSVRSGERADLVATLRRFAADRAERHETERSAEASRAADVLEGGADGAYFERVIYVVGDPDRYSVVSGSRDQVLIELKQGGIGWDHQGKAQLVSQAVRGYEAVEQGAEVTRVGHLVYLVRG